MGIKIPQVNSGGYRLISPGDYVVEVIALEEAQNTGQFGNDPRATWTFKLVSVVQSEDPAAQTFVGTQHIEFTSISMAPLAKMYGFITALLGRTVMPGEEITSAALIGRQMIATLVHYPKQNGYTGVKIESVRPLLEF